MASKSTYQDIQRRCLYFMTVLTVTGFLLFVICVSTSFWNSYILPPEYYDPNLGGIWTHGHSGLWTVCKVGQVNNTDYQSLVEVKLCKTRHLFPTELTLSEIDKTIIDLYRSQSAFAVICLILMALSHVFVVYSLRQPRYTFKRIVGCLHFMSAACIIVVGEININAVEYEKNDLHLFPLGSVVYYGVSFVLSWFSFAFYLIAGVAFFVFSRKRKHDRVPEDELEGNEPIRLGRY